MAKSNEFKAEIILIIAGLSFGNTPILSAILRDNNVSALEQVFIRAVIGSLFGIIVILLTFQFLNRGEIYHALTKNNQFFYAIQGLILTIMIMVYFISIALDTPVGEAALLVQIHPLLTLVLGALILKEKFSREKIISLLIAFAGLFILIRPWEFTSFLTHIVGDIFAMLNGVFYSFYLIVGRLSKNHRLKVSPLVSISFVLIWVLITFLPILAIMTLLPLNPIISSFSLSVYNSVFILEMGLLLGLLGSVVPYGLIMIGSRYVESSRTAILVLGEPLGAIVLGLLILREPITIYYILGGGLLLFAIIYLTMAGSKPSSKASIILQNSS